jgi:hypothetical protein
MPQPTPDVTHDLRARRFVAQTEDGPAVLAYEQVGPDVLDLQHTVVPEAARGGGVGDALVRAAFTYARAEGLQLVPTCPFVHAWLERHPEEADLQAR